MTTRNADSMGAYGSTWAHRGYAGQGRVERVVDSIKGQTAIVCGNGAGVLAQAQLVRTWYPDAVVFAVNDIGMYLPRVDHWVSLHVDKLQAWRAVRWLEPRDGERLVCHSDTVRPWLDVCWQQLTPQFCLSGYYAMQLAWVMGADRIVLCGCPGDDTPRWFETQGRGFQYGAGEDSHGIRQQLEREMRRLPEFKAAVRSMSGWTKTFFGGLDDGREEEEKEG